MDTMIHRPNHPLQRTGCLARICRCRRWNRMFDARWV